MVKISDLETYNIKLLPQLSAMFAGDFFLIQSASSGTSLFDIKYIVIGLDNITFSPLLCSFSTNIDYLSSVIDQNNLNTTISFDTLSSNVDNDIETINTQISSLNDTVSSIDVDSIESSIDQNTSNIVTLSANEISDIINLQSQIDDLTNTLNVLFTLVSSNSAFTLRGNAPGDLTANTQWA